MGSDGRNTINIRILVRKAVQFVEIVRNFVPIIGGGDILIRSGKNRGPVRGRYATSLCDISTIDREATHQNLE